MLLRLPRNRQLLLDKCKLMAILNVTPDSFSDGGKFVGHDAALRQVEQMLKDGADIIDIGGESTRPGAAEVSISEELDRVIPVIELVRREFDTVISIDTYKTAVMKAAIAAGADIINDVRALQDEGAVEVAVQTQVPVCLMHMRGMPGSMQQLTDYQQVTDEVLTFLTERASFCIKAGIAPGQIILDPGFGFAKTLAQNYQLLSGLSKFQQSGFAVLAGMSRKSMIGQLLNRPVSERLAGSIACATIAVMHGARIIRTHDVRETADAIAVAEATMSGELE
ncbi:dihydropteroate synthase [Rheinheimera sp. 4Y26]|uniref:dihydropteroate synthase n=1 Tax=Rheinheimera sp. 4Y26 TaxID=2977811 RepID=UPI0021B0F3E7|nr:dihydropteroate synthase [Rheinheimera sp. 4Y26]MCT6700206.1 dihydropteroate synthase [Rheinheimera sp. 4Y26]